MSINNNENHDINRGIELMLRRRKKTNHTIQNEKREIRKKIKFLNFEIFFLIQFSKIE